jgi:3-oxoacyl-[acyl-carrier protein] reductase
LGSAIALTLAKEGASVAISGRNREALAKVVKEIEATGVRANSESFDLNDLAALKSFLSRVASEIGAIDILVNISGGPPPTAAANVPPEQWIKEFQSIIVPMIHATDLVLPGMKAKRRGRIITCTSAGIVAPIPNLGISNTLRPALAGWSKTLAREVAADGITVNVVIPGRIATARLGQLDEARAKREGKSVEEIEKSSAASIPMQRYGEPQEFANAVAFLASSKASYITGSMIRVDGGMIPSVSWARQWKTS